MYQQINRMNFCNHSLFLIFSFFLLLMTGCSNQVAIKSATPDTVVITGPSEKFVDAYHMAQKECQKDAKNASYIADATADLGIVTFNCVGEEVATETQTEADAETEETTVQ